MNPGITKTSIAIVILTSILSTPIATASLFPPYLSGPPVVRFIGTFQPAGEKDASGLNTLTVSIQNQKWLFQVSRVDTITGSDPGMMLLNYIFPPQLRFFGPPDRLAPLESPEIAGKQVTLEGFLYIQDRTFYVASATIAS